jgi:hypothetical protein
MARKWKTPAIRRTHRSVGAAAAVFVLFMVLSGVAINHSNGLGLDQRHVSNGYLLSHYGINAPDIQSFQLDDDWLSLAGSWLYFNQTAVAEIAGGLGAVASKQWIVVAGHDELLVLDQLGELVERLAWRQISATAVEAVGLASDGRITVKSDGGLWIADGELLDWQQILDGGEIVQWASPSPAPAELERLITRHYQGDGLSMERLLLDLHSGRVFGPLGVLAYDLLALATGFLALSGLVLWFRSRRNGKSR